MTDPAAGLRVPASNSSVYAQFDHRSRHDDSQPDRSHRMGGRPRSRAGSCHTGVCDPLPVTWASRTEQAGGKTSPEKFLVAAHSSCFAIALNLVLGERSIRADKTRVWVTVALNEVEGKPTITTSRVIVRATVPGARRADVPSRRRRSRRDLPGLAAVR